MSESNTVPVGIALGAGVGALALGAVTAWAIAPDAPQGPTQAVPTVTVDRPAASFSWEHEASQEDPFSPNAGINAFTMNYPDGSAEWCFTVVLPSAGQPELHCKPVPAPSRGTTMEDHQ